ncbi:MULTISPECIES: hypothetical protein [unclassified Nonomuraea]|uniref:hypothetical protein n=1 Tax=unclassified Nonomuraea TaxID=2593643 RepID=UPI0034063B63
MPHITPHALERLFQRDPDVTMCLHGLRSSLVPTTAGPVAVTRIVGHLVLGVPAEDDGQEIPEEFALVLDLPLPLAKLAVARGHFDDTMDQMMDSALDALITEDGET